MVNIQRKILIIEDDDLINQMYLAALASSNFLVKLEKDGEAGWQTMQTFLPSLVILDFMLPKLNGIEVLQKMRLDERFKNTPVIMMSSLSSDADKKRAMDAGATVYWIKNQINMIEFEEKINEVMQ
jgi:DNA-binding response OmpR family regulator